MPSSVPKIQAFLKETFTLSIQRKVPAPGSIFNLPILNQLGFMLPRYIPLGSMSVSWPAGVDKLREVRNHVTELPPTILLVSGSDDEDQNATFDVFNPKGYSDKLTACAFQLQPVYWVFCIPPGNPGNFFIQLGSGDEWPTLTSRLTAKEQDMNRHYELWVFLCAWTKWICCCCCDILRWCCEAALLWSGEGLRWTILSIDLLISRKRYCTR